MRSQSPEYNAWREAEAALRVLESRLRERQLDLAHPPTPELLEEVMVARQRSLRLLKAMLDTMSYETRVIVHDMRAIGQNAP